MRTAYAVAFSGDRFLMVWHSRRHGWEMPGGHVEEGETSAQAAAREFEEEAGYRIEVLETRDIGYCDVCAAVLGRKVRDDCEMESRLFSELPEQLSFSPSTVRSTRTRSHGQGPSLTGTNQIAEPFDPAYLL